MQPNEWTGVHGELAAYVRDETQNTLQAYARQKNFVDEHANQEQDTARGGYAQRQLVELIQNAADQLVGGVGGRVEVHLTDTHLYCADDGAPFDREGVRALMHSHLSPKRDTSQIGRFGVGFKSVLRVTDSPAVFSRTGSFQFDRVRAAEQIRAIAPDRPVYPVLRVAEPLRPVAEAHADPLLHQLMAWAVNIVRLPLKPGANPDLARQMKSFDPAFVLFVPDVQELNFVAAGADASRVIRRRTDGDEVELLDGDETSTWMIFPTLHRLSTNAIDDRRGPADEEEVRIIWAAPKTRRPGIQQFWAYFPTQTSSLVGGILNAPWNTNEDRQSLLPGPFNDELIAAAANLVAQSLPRLWDGASPAQHLDVLPRRAESGDDPHADGLRRELYSRLRDAAVVPDQDGQLHSLAELKIPPEELTPGQRVHSQALDRWLSYPHRPSDWLHHEALQSERMAALSRMHVSGQVPRGYLPRTTLSEWLEALVNRGVRQADNRRASMAAIQVAELIPAAQRQGKDLGRIVLTAANSWQEPKPDVLFIGGGRAQHRVHDDLASDSKTLAALKSLGLGPPSPENAFRNTAADLLADGGGDVVGVDMNARWKEFWRQLRRVEDVFAITTIKGHDLWPQSVCVKTIGDVWSPLSRVLLPGPVVPSDGSRDAKIAVDTDYHQDDLGILDRLGVRSTPSTGRWEFDLNARGPLGEYAEDCITDYYSRDLPRKPQGRFLPSPPPETSGPLEMFPELSETGRARFTGALLSLKSTFAPWLMWHQTTDEVYPKMEVQSLAVALIHRFGRVELTDEMPPLVDGLGSPPKNPDAQRWLLRHPNTHLIREALGLTVEAGGAFETIGEDDPLPVTDVWPGIADHLNEEQQFLDLVRCDRLIDADGNQLPLDCVIRDKAICLQRNDNEGTELRSVIRELGLDLTEDVLDAILRRETRHDVERERASVRAEHSDAARLLKAVGEENLRRRLPDTLIDILSEAARPFRSVRVAEAAIATYHTGALREYKADLARLDPPRQWTGRRPALEFVRSLGFSDEWAGQPKPKRPPYEEVVGPRSLPDLHPYQRRAVERIKSALTAREMDVENRGLLSMPTGSGKTRVAVQAIIEATRDEGFQGSVLWVADRDELCEQAVEAWQQAWRSIGPEAAELRISRMWSGQPRPEPKQGANHVIVATIQTLRARVKVGQALPDYLASVGLLVVDEAHGSIAPSYTSLMAELGLTFRRREDEINLLGLTATPYRGRDLDETARLVNRYGANRLDAGAFASDDPQEVIRELQKMTVLAQVDHDVIQGLTLRLSPREIRQMSGTPWLPEETEQRIARNAERTRRIVDAYITEIRKIDPNAPTLIFATSVAHAETVAALLQLEGIEARTVSGKTDPAVRRSVVEEFRDGTVQVLVNYGVFREGFDAPKTRAIIVARPVYSPNLYFQMIGRGLRGELNGGSERCLILDVADNIENYDRQLAYTELEGLWD